MIRANLYTFTATGAFLNIKFRYGFLLVPGYRTILTDIKALSTVYTTEITLLPTRNIP